MILRSLACWLALVAAFSFVGTAVAPSHAAVTADGKNVEQLLAESDFHGGLVVQVGGDAEAVLAAARSPGVLGHVLLSHPDQVDAVRRLIHEAGLEGRVSAKSWEGPYLPYADGMVNRLLVTSEGTTLDEEEIDRVLAPLGIAWTLEAGVLTPYRKPWPDDIDQWTHSRYDATGNAVSRDQRVGPPRYLQWDATPRWNRGVKTSGLVSTRGRLFYILDDSHFAARGPTWSVIARDANNGIRLWRRELGSWGGAWGGKKVGPAQMHRRLVADDTHVFVTLGESAPVSVLDAATGQMVRTLEGTGPTDEMLLSGGVLVVLVNPGTPTHLRRTVAADRRLMAIDARSGELLWERDGLRVLPMTLAADDRQVVYHDGESIRSLALATGAPRWTSPPTGQKIEFRAQAHPDSPGAEKSTILLAPQFAPTLVMYEDVVAFAGGRRLNVVSADDGRELWRTPFAATNYSVPVDLFGFGGYLWGPDAAMNLWRPLDDDITFKAYDPLTGDVVRTVQGHYNYPFQHHRCYQMKVVGDTILASRAGVEFLDTETADVVANHWTRGSCYYGILPANGRLYAPPHNCACYVRAKLSGFLAMNSEPPARRIAIPEDARFERGPAYGTTAADRRPADPEDWPTYRHDAGRSGRASTRLGAELTSAWQTPLGGRLTAPVVAGERVYVARTDGHTLHALDAATGRPLWQATFDGAIDSPPSVYQGLVLCGCRDGSVHALRAEDGVRVWRFLAAPEERLIVSRGQLESAWPVSGSVLVTGGVAYFTAGRSSYLDGGIRLYGLEPHSGRKVVDRVICSRRDDGSETLDEQGVVGCLNDILSSDGERLFLRHQGFDFSGQPRQERVTHLHGPDGWLSGETTNRLLWTYAPSFTSLHQGAFYDLRLSRVLFPSGRILAEDDQAIYGYGQIRFSPPISEPGGQWVLFAAEKASDAPLDLSAREYRKLALGGKSFVRFRWREKVPVNVRAMVKTDELLLVAGPEGSPLTTQAALDGREPARLLAVSPDGTILAERELPSTPVWDGMAAAGEGLYLALAGGEVVCLRDAK